jgi:predicted Zn-dependent protease
MPRRAVRLIEKGVAEGVVYDRKSAKKWGKECTGHGFPQPNTIGPVPSNLVLKPGQASLEELIAGTERGVLVTQFHYVNVIDPTTLLLTGMTRNGTFLIEEGKVVRPLKNLRFTQSVVEAFNKVDGLTGDVSLVSGFFGGTVVVPGMKLKEFNFTSTTDF